MHLEKFQPLIMPLLPFVSNLTAYSRQSTSFSCYCRVVGAMLGCCCTEASVCMKDYGVNIMIAGCIIISVGREAVGGWLVPQIYRWMRMLLDYGNVWLKLEVQHETIVVMLLFQFWLSARQSGHSGSLKGTLWCQVLELLLLVALTWSMVVVWSGIWND